MGMAAPDEPRSLSSAIEDEARFEEAVKKVARPSEAELEPE